jgi:hypothetical protein
MNKWKYDTKEWEDFANFVVGVSLIMCGVFVVMGLVFMLLKKLGILFV